MLVSCEKITSEEVRTNCGDLASLLLGLYMSLPGADKGDNPGVLTAVKRAMITCQDLVDKYAHALKPTLAQSLRELPIYLSQIEMRGEALIASRVVVDIHRKLAWIYPDRFEFALAEALYTFSICLHDVEREEEALDGLEEIVKLCRKLKHERPTVPTLDSADLIHAIFTRLQGMKESPKEGINFVQKSVEILKEVQEPISTYNSTLARSLRILSTCHSDSGDWASDISEELSVEVGKQEIFTTLLEDRKSVV